MRIREMILIMACTALVITLACAISAEGVPNESWFPNAPPFIDKNSVIHQASAVNELLNAIENVNEGETILVTEVEVLDFRSGGFRFES